MAKGYSQVCIECCRGTVAEDYWQVGDTTHGLCDNCGKPNTIRVGMETVRWDTYKKAKADRAGGQP